MMPNNDLNDFTSIFIDCVKRILITVDAKNVID